ncbi:flagellar basal-body rod protein FlgG [Pacificimonas sp. WHA3]|uniref:Flagellar basal-body rod protein FlgG n=1 Tax=Pacificimonas pallii TaxID=2827236 RepID=A0ABS6SF99_9SPHN|nr:flagellar basal-body rod protein FlgG [Pacificimonas pallii]MBV7257016.1 flagellar basal-body rod protein FlgG [Pacificimonas pallii]
MSSALHIARSGLDAQDTRMRVISNNLANVNTTGFKRDRADFESLMYQNMSQAGSPTSGETERADGLNMGTGVRTMGTERMLGQGELMQTANPLDIALDGPGHFQVTLPDGSTAYTRDGAFRLSDQGDLVTSSGYRLEPQITIPEGSNGISIGTNGVVSITLPNQPEPVEVGTIDVASFLNEAGLQAIGDNLFLETGASGPAVIGEAGIEGRGRIRQSSLEASNVNVVEELVQMIETQRAYEVNSKVISTVDGMLRYVTQNI